MKKQAYHVLVAAAGKGLRANTKKPKQYIDINYKNILLHTLENIQNWPGDKSIRVIIHPDHKDMYHEAIDPVSAPELRPPVLGGKERFESISNALQQCPDIKDDDIILIHDAARPFTKAADVQTLLDAMDSYNAATLATPVSDTLRKGDDRHEAGDTVSRDGLWALQTPQAFRAGILKEAHAKRDGTGFTDDTALVSALHVPVKFIGGSCLNFKITTADDIEMAEKLLDTKPSVNFRTGSGFDVHAFSDSAAEMLRLCGVDIPYHRALKGHSDADVGLHALTDALLGALGEGDIGQHFPPSDDSFKNMDSAVFLQKPLDILRARKGEIVNVDLTIIGENPKIGPHRQAIKNRLSDLLRIHENEINVKATTTERLGFTGREEGLAAQALVTIKVPA